MNIPSDQEADLARLSVGVLTDSDLPELATRWLVAGLSSHYLGALAGETADANAFVMRDLFDRALRDLGMVKPTAHEATLLLRSYWLQQLAVGARPPFECLERLTYEVHRHHDEPDPEGGFVGQTLGIGEFIGCYWSIRDAEEGGRLNHEERLRAEQAARDEARLCLERLSAQPVVAADAPKAARR
jgi:hypothetical protein